jgi:RNHCP domain
MVVMRHASRVFCEARRTGAPQAEWRGTVHECVCPGFRVATDLFAAAFVSWSHKAVPRISFEATDSYDYDLTERRSPRVRSQHASQERRRKPSPHHDMRKVVEGRESFKCGHCRAFVGPTVSGGRHRNHCPLCLHSRHVDRGHPGDRLCECRSLMEPVGLCSRRNGEQVIVHRCLGCEAERVCRVAADDNPLVVMRLPLIQHPGTQDAGSIFEFDEESA